MSKTYNGHVLFERGDVDAPEQIKDRNGDIVLQCCKLCGAAEIELIEACLHLNAVCIDEGCPHHGTPHVCISPILHPQVS